MSEHARARRWPNTARDEPAPPRRPDDPRQAGLLALQRTAGNQMVQRLLFNQRTRKLTVPQTYADQRIPFANGWLEGDRDATGDDPTFLKLVNEDNGKLLPYVASGIDVKKVEGVAAMADATLANGAASLADATAAQGTDAALRAVAPAADRVLLYPGAPAKYFDPAELDSHFVLQPKDFFPEKPDLPASGHPVRQQIKGAMAGQQLWNLTCVLIALVKADGHAPVKKLTNKTTSTLDDAVQALHDHYVTAGVQYDDTSTRFRVMNDWGYKPVFSGKVPWRDLPTKIGLSPGHYIFDIVGHTVLVEVLQGFQLNGPPIGNLDQYFKCKSEGDNYRKKEFAQDVQYIWTK